MITFFGFLVNCFDVYMLTIIASRFCERRWREKWKSLLFITLLGSLTTLNVMHVESKGFSVTIIAVTIIASIKAFYKGKLGSVVSFIIWFAIISICDLISVNMFSLGTGLQVTDVVLNNSIISVICAIFTRMLEYIIVAVLFKKIQDNLAKSFRIYRSMFYITTGVILINVFIFYVHVALKIPMSNIFLLYLSFSVVIYFIFILYLIYKLETIARDNEKQALINLENQMTREYSEKIEIMVERFHQLNHDYRFHIQSLKSLLDRHLYDNAKEYFEEIVESFEHSVKGFIDKHPVISILLMKTVKQAEEENIKFKCAVPKGFDLMMSESDFNIILSNLLENAFQAVRDMQGEKRWIMLEIVERKEQLMVIVENPYQNEIVKEGLLFKTSKKDTLKHGHGLKSIRNIVQKTGGFVDIESEKGVFSVTLICPKKE